MNYQCTRGRYCRVRRRQRTHRRNYRRRWRSDRWRTHPDPIPRIHRCPRTRWCWRSAESPSDRYTGKMFKTQQLNQLNGSQSNSPFDRYRENFRNIFPVTSTWKLQVISYLETAGCVAALSALAEEVVDGTFVDVGALFTGRIHLVARITNTTVCPQHIFASTVGTHIRVLGAFINICKKEKEEKTVS